MNYYIRIKLQLSAKQCFLKIHYCDSYSSNIVIVNTIPIVHCIAMICSHRESYLAYMHNVFVNHLCGRLLNSSF